MNEHNIKTIAITIMSLVILLGIIWIAVNHYNYEEEIQAGLQEKCQNLGYQKLTDQKEHIGSNYQIECDGQVQTTYTHCGTQTTCLQTNKWGDCEKHAPKKIQCT